MASTSFSYWIFRYRSCQEVTNYFTFVPSKVLFTSKNFPENVKHIKIQWQQWLLIVRVVYRRISTNTFTQRPLFCPCGQPIQSNTRSSQFVVYTIKPAFPHYTNERNLSGGNFPETVLINSNFSHHVGLVSFSCLVKVRFFLCFFSVFFCYPRDKPRPERAFYVVFYYCSPLAHLP